MLMRVWKMRGNPWFSGHLFSVLAGLLLAAAVPAWAREDYREVAADELLRNPQNYWSLGILFRDTLMAQPTGRRLRIGHTRYIEFTTKKLGACYAVEEIAPLLESLPVGREYLFTGTVLTRGPGTFGRTPTFYVVVQNVAESLAEADQPARGLLDAALKLPAGEKDRSSAAVARVFASVHAALFAYAERNDLQISQLFEPGSEHAAKVTDIIQSALLSVQREQNITPIEILGQFIRDTLARYYGLQAPPAPASAGEAATEAKAPAPPPVLTAEAPAAKPAPIPLRTGTPVAAPLDAPPSPPQAPQPAQAAVEPAATAGAQRVSPPGKILLDYELPVSR